MALLKTTNKLFYLNFVFFTIIIIIFIMLPRGVKT